ncbi:MAG: biotin/lipoyl-binding protein [Actinobacteria bacterium]|nr:biotin/lipoyl-binding protein [Actinomycetota bacterium]
MADLGPRGRRRRRRAIVLVGCLPLAGLAVWFLGLRHQSGDGTKAAPASEVVKRGNVRSTVAGVGVLQPKTSVSLGFGAAGRVSAVDVHLGQEVGAGQVLARLDDTVPRAALAASRAQVTAAEAKVAQLVEGHTPEEARKAGVETSGAISAATGAKLTAAKARGVAAGDVRALRSTVEQARRTHDVAVKRLSESRSKLGQKTQRTSTAKAQYETTKAAVEAARDQIVALAATREANHKRGEEEEAKERKRFEEAEKKEREKAEAEEKEFKGGKEQSVVPRNTETGTSYAEAQAQAQLESAQSAATEAQARYERFRGEAETLRTSLPGLRDTARSTGESVSTAKTSLQAGVATAAQTVRTANETAEVARSTLNTAVASGEVALQPTRSGEMEEAIAAVVQAENNVATNEKSVEESVLRAPTAGRVVNLKLAVGDVVSGGTTSQAKAGTSGEGPEGAAAGGGGEGEGAAGGSGAGSAAPSIVLASPRLRLFAVSLTQADAVKVKPGDPASLLVDALSRTVKGSLVSITPLPQVKNGVVNYSATVATEELPRELRVGMTAEVTVLTANRHGVPVLSPAALPAGTGTVKVQVMAPGGPEPRTVQLGLSGENDVEIKKGLRPGDRVVLPKLPEAGSFEEEGEEGSEEGGGEEEGLEG